MRLAPWLLLAAVSALPPAARADEYGHKERGLRCYTGDLLAELRIQLQNGPDKLSTSMKTTIDNADNVAVLLDFKRVKDAPVLVVSTVRKKDSKVREARTLAKEDPDFKALIQVIPTLRD